jgi:hypothetical protein
MTWISTILNLPLKIISSCKIARIDQKNLLYKSMWWIFLPVLKNKDSLLLCLKLGSSDQRQLEGHTHMLTSMLHVQYNEPINYSIIASYIHYLLVQCAPTSLNSWSKASMISNGKRKRDKHTGKWIAKKKSGRGGPGGWRLPGARTQLPVPRIYDMIGLS